MALYEKNFVSGTSETPNVIEVIAPQVVASKVDGELEIVVEWLNRQSLPYRLQIAGKTWSNRLDDDEASTSNGKRRKVVNRFPWREWAEALKKSNKGDRLRFKHDKASLQAIQHRICTLATPIFGSGGYTTYQLHDSNEVELEVLRSPGLYRLQQAN